MVICGFAAGWLTSFKQLTAGKVLLSAPLFIKYTSDRRAVFALLPKNGASCGRTTNQYASRQEKR